LEGKKGIAYRKNQVSGIVGYRYGGMGKDSGFGWQHTGY
jgi:hypothetical protein